MLVLCIMDTTTVVSTPPVIDPLDVNDFEVSAGTIAGKNKRLCPCCKKNYKVEDLGPHVKSKHPVFWSALFTVDTLQTSIDTKGLVHCSIAYGDHDQKFMVCLACDSIRTTDRNHFQKNGKLHEDSHYEKCTQMIAVRKGIQYVPKAQTDMEKLLTQLDKYKRMAKMCEHNHSDIAAAMSDKEDAEVKLAQVELHNKELTSMLQKRVKELNDSRKIASMCIGAISNITKDLGHVDRVDKVMKGIGAMVDVLRLML